MAMGDINAVEVGQESHIKLALRAGVCLQDLITGPYVGVVIDDFVAMEVVPRPFPADLASVALADKMVDIYSSVGLVAHDGKRFRKETKAKFWGASLDGERGTVRGQGYDHQPGCPSWLGQPQVAFWSLDRSSPMQT